MSDKPLSTTSTQLRIKINQLLLVEAGHKVVRKKPGETGQGCADSFCVETHVPNPTGQNLLWDAMCCDIRHAAALAKGSGDWYLITKVIKPAFNQVRSAWLIQQSPVRLEEYLAVCRPCLKRMEQPLLRPSSWN